MTDVGQGLPGIGLSKLVTIARFGWLRLVSEHEGTRGARSRGTASVGNQVCRHLAGLDDRVAPLVQLDPLREQIGTQAMGRTPDRVKLQGHGTAQRG